MDIFDIIGPIMVGPSSSHTAGAVRIGRVTRALLGEQPRKVSVVFHGSFAKTYKGHGTDKAVVGGLMDMATDDPNIKNSLSIAKSYGLDFEINTGDLGDVHPNTVLIKAQSMTKSIEVLASSIGGGRIVVRRINGLEVNFTGDLYTLVVFHKDAPGAVANVSDLLAKARINIAQMRVFRTRRGGNAVMVIDLDDQPDGSIIKSISCLQGINNVVMIPPV